MVAGTAPLSAGLAMGLAFLTTGVAFKIAAVPFHYWTPDAYQGSPTPITGYLSVGPKVGAFALILRLFVEALGPLAEWWLPVMIGARDADDDPGQPRGADPGQRQADARRTARSPTPATCWSGWRPTPAASSPGSQGLLFYAAAYAFMNLGAFARRRRAPEAARRDVARSTRSPGWAGASRCSACS